MARSFSSTAGYLSQGVAGLSPPTTAAMSIGGWFWAASLPTTTWTICGISTVGVSNSYAGLAVGISGGNSQMQAFSSNGSQSNATSSLVLSAATWYHGLATFGGGTETVYANGANSGTGTVNTPGS